MSSNVSAIILAAGLSTRMGQTKALVRIHGLSLLQWVVRSLSDHCAPILVVTGHDRESVSTEARQLGALPVHNHMFLLGMLSSIQTGAKAVLDTTAQGALIAPVDVLVADSFVPEKLIERWLTTGCSVAIPTYQGQSGHPAWFDRYELTRLAALDPTINTARDIVRNARHLETVPVNTSDIICNLNTPHDVKRWAERHL